MTKLLSKLAYDRLHEKADDVSLVKDYVGAGIAPMILGPSKKKDDASSKQASLIQGYVENVKENPLTHIGAATGVILSLLTSKGTMTDRAIDAGLSGASLALLGFAGDTVMDARRGVNEQREQNKNTTTIRLPKLSWK